MAHGVSLTPRSRRTMSCVSAGSASRGPPELHALGRSMAGEPRQGQPASPVDYTIRIVLALAEEVRLRIGLQNKCVELSILVSTALTGTAFVAIGADEAISLVDLRTELPWIVLLSGYVLVQVLILANYIHQTTMIMITGEYLRSHSGLSDQQQFEAINVLTGAPTLMGIGAGQRRGRAAARLFQPAVLYGSIYTALGVVSVLGANMYFTFDLRTSIVISAVVLALWVAFIMLRAAHNRAFKVQRTALAAGRGSLRSASSVD